MTFSTSTIATIATAVSITPPPSSTSSSRPLPFEPLVESTSIPTILENEENEEEEEGKKTIPQQGQFMSSSRMLATLPLTPPPTTPSRPVGRILINHQQQETRDYSYSCTRNYNNQRSIIATAAETETADKKGGGDDEQEQVPNDVKTKMKADIAGTAVNGKRREGGGGRAAAAAVISASKARHDYFLTSADLYLLTPATTNATDVDASSIDCLFVAADVGTTCADRRNEHSNHHSKKHFVTPPPSASSASMQPRQQQGQQRGRPPTYYYIQELEELALHRHGYIKLAQKRAKRLIRHCKKNQQTPLEQQHQQKQELMVCDQHHSSRSSYISSSKSSNKNTNKHHDNKKRTIEMVIENENDIHNENNVVKENVVTKQNNKRDDKVQEKINSMERHHAQYSIQHILAQQPIWNAMVRGEDTGTSSTVAATAGRINNYHHHLVRRPFAVHPPPSHHHHYNNNWYYQHNQSINQPKHTTTITKSIHEATTGGARARFYTPNDRAQYCPHPSFFFRPSSSYSSSSLAEHCRLPTHHHHQQRDCNHLLSHGHHHTSLLFTQRQQEQEQEKLRLYHSSLYSSLYCTPSVYTPAITSTAIKENDSSHCSGDGSTATTEVEGIQPIKNSNNNDTSIDHENRKKSDGDIFQKKETERKEEIPTNNGDEVEEDNPVVDALLNHDGQRINDEIRNDDYAHNGSNKNIDNDVNDDDDNKENIDMVIKKSNNNDSSSRNVANNEQLLLTC